MEELRRNAIRLYLSVQLICLGILISSIQHGWEYLALAMVIPVALLGYVLGAQLEASRGD